MAAIKLKALPEYQYSVPMKIRVTDLNYGGHLGNDKAIGLLHQARIEVLSKLGLTELDLGDGETGLIQTDMAVTYAGEGFLNDEIIVDVAFHDFRPTRFRMSYRISCGDKALNFAEMGFAGFSYTRHKPSALPETFVKQVK